MPRKFASVPFFLVFFDVSGLDDLEVIESEESGEISICHALERAFDLDFRCAVTCEDGDVFAPSSGIVGLLGEECLEVMAVVFAYRVAENDDFVSIL